MDQVQTPEGIASVSGKVLGGFAGGIAGTQVKAKIKAGKQAKVESGKEVEPAVEIEPEVETTIKDNVKKTEGGGKTVDVKLSKKKYPESAQHIEEAIKDGQPDTLTIDRGGASSRRKASLKGVDTVPGLDRDEYPPAMSLEGGTGASVKLINPSDNRGSGSSISSQLRKYPNGTKYRIIITEDD